MFHWGILSKKCQKPGVHKKGGLAILGGCLEKMGSNLMQTMNVVATKTQYIYLWQEIKQNKKDNGKNHTDVLFGSLIQTERKAKMKRDDPLHNC